MTTVMTRENMMGFEEFEVHGEVPEFSRETQPAVQLGQTVLNNLDSNDFKTRANAFQTLLDYEEQTGTIERSVN